MKNNYYICLNSFNALPKMKQKIFYLLFLVSLFTMPAVGKGGVNESRSACSINVTVNSTPYYCAAEGGVILTV